MIDTNNVIQLRRVHYACPVERPERPEPLTITELIGWGYEELSRIDWSAVAQLVGSKR